MSSQQGGTCKTETHSDSVAKLSQMQVDPSKLAVANNFPDGDQAHDFTVLVSTPSKTA